jgi:hypothetical protein
MEQPNFKLKGIIIAQFGTLAQAARLFDMREDRLSRVIHNRVRPSRDEMRTISWRLQKKISELWPSEAQDNG